MATDRAAAPKAADTAPATADRAPLKPKRPASRPVAPLPRRPAVFLGGASAPRRPARPVAGGGQPSGGAAPPAPALTLKGPAAAAATDPRFKGMLDKLQRSASRSRQHPPAKKKSAEAQAASAPPKKEEQEANARATKVEAMDAAPEGKPPAEDTFLTALRKAIAETMPKTVEDGDTYMQGDDRSKVTQAVTGNIQDQKAQATGPVEKASNEPPHPDQAETKPVTPLPGEPAPPAPLKVDAAEAMPAPKPQAEVSLDQGKRDTNSLLTDNQLTPNQLQKANDPRFSSVLTTKAEADRVADTGPAAYRAQEGQIVGAASTQATNNEKQALAAFHAQQLRSGHGVRAHQLTAKEKDEAERKAVIDHIQAIYDKTKKAVDEKLSSLETEATTLFDKESGAAIERMKKYVEDRFDDRYSGWTGGALWLKDKIWPLPDFIKDWFTQAHDQFERDLDRLVVNVARLVETRLKESKKLIADGELEIKNYVAGLSPKLKSVGETAAKDVQDRFNDLRHTVDDKKSALVQNLAQRYKDAHDKGDAALKALKDKHKSLYERVRDFVKEVVEVLRNFKNRVVAMIKKAMEVIGIIIGDPIGFLGNLLSAIKQGLFQFVDKIGEHLKEALFEFLFGSLASAGIVVPKEFSLGSILKLLLAVLGLTYDRIRAKAVRLIGERNVMIIEKAWAIIHTLLTGGPSALWEQIQPFIGNLPDMVIGAIKNWIITTVIKVAITKVAMMFNPVGAIIQAILTIYNTVMFLIENITKIVDFVQAVFDSIADIARGNIGAAANWIEKALVKMLVLLIGFLARFAGVSGITEKIKEFIKNVQDKVDVAVDKLIDKVVAGVKKLFGGGGAKQAAAPGKPQDSTGVAAEAGQLLIDRTSGKEETEDEVRAIVAKISSELRPRGLKRFEIGPPDAEGNEPVLAEASPISVEAMLRLARLGYSVAMRTNVHFKKAQALTTPRVFRRTDVPVEGVPGAFVHAASVAEGGALVFPGGSAPGSAPQIIVADQVQVTTFNRGNKDRRRDSNESHAEVQFISWFNSDVSTESLEQLKSIEIHINRSPCSACASDICRLMRGRLQSKKGIVHIKWAGLHNRGDNPTTVEDVTALESCGVDIGDSIRPKLTRAQAGKDSRFAIGRKGG